MAAPPSQSVSAWFEGRNVFVTGGSGFMGKVLIYKLLVSCPNLGNIFMLVRKKKDVDPQTRLLHMLQQEPFKSIKEKSPEKVKKLILVPGDTTMDGLALSTADKERLIKEVSVVFHMAANVKFDLTLKEAVRINTQGTMNVLKLAKQMTSLDSFVHVSTAYCHCHEPELEERNYPVPVQPEVMIDTVNNLSEDVLVSMTPKLLEGQPNTYAFSKALSEDLVQRSGLPAAVARPSIVLASLKEPAPGWVENLNGPTGLMIGAGKGVIRTMLCNDKYFFNIVPCDIAINGIIAMAWKVGIEKPQEPIYMNVTNGAENPITWRKAIEMGKVHARNHPFSGILWYPGGTNTNSVVYHWIRVILFHLIPAYLLDGVIMLSGNKPFLVRVQQKVNAGIKIVTYYTTKQWIFRNDRMKELHQQLSPSDKEEFFMDIASVSWNEFLLTYLLGIRKFTLKDDPSTLPRARQVMNYMYYADRFVKIAMVLLIMWFLYSCVNTTRELAITPYDIKEI
ncbi:putative fatty acyl-CoA reductase CG5065 [Augochlora pura]